MSRNDAFDNDYKIKAPNVSIISETSPLPPTASQICISALGGGELLQNGSVTVTATGNISMQCGPSVIGINGHPANAGIAILNGLPGTISVTQGAVPGAPQLKMSDLPPSVKLTLGPETAGGALTLEPAAVTLKYGPPGVGSILEMGPTGVTIKSGPWSMHLGPEGFEVKVGPNKLSVQPQGIALNGLMLDLAATTNLNVKALQLEEKALKRQDKAAMTMIG